MLRRRLSEAGLSLADLLDEVRQDLALLYLRHTDCSLLEIACLLGFAEQSSFSRAFRRWTGRPPAEYRREDSPQSPEKGHAQCLPNRDLCTIARHLCRVRQKKLIFSGVTNPVDFLTY